ncbi:MAG: AAA family ATPase [Proteobacteria bacterium]|nr:AAA family ATPase [Pseudomonadota bacterium]
MRCPACDEEIPEGSKFCNACGTSLPRVCQSCGEANAPRAKFCSECGTQLAPSSRRPEQIALTRPEAERRQLTVMFCDLVGSTRLAGRLDPEDLREVTRAYQEVSSRVIRQFDGYVAQLLGDGLLVYFGYPNAHEDDAQRAGRAGLEIISAIGDLNTRLKAEMNVEIAVRIGIHTGTTVVGAMGDEVHRERLAIGETPNIAARVQGLAQPNAAVVSAATARLMRGYFEWEDLGRHELAGVAQPMHLYRLIRTTTTRGRLTTQEEDNKLTPIVGRDADLEQILECWNHSSQGRGQIVLISGEAGIGKSRLIHAFATSLAAHEHIWLHCSCSPFYTSTALRPMVEMLSRLCGLRHDDDAESRLTKLEAQLAALDLQGGDAVPVLAHLLSVAIPADRYHPLVLSPQMRKQRIQNLLLDSLLRIAGRNPLVLAIEDLHWLDQSTLDFLGLLAERLKGARMMALLTTRPPFREPWSVDTSIALRTLAGHEVAELIRNITGGKDVPQKVIELVAAKSDGNPLYVEELTRMLLESGQLVERFGAYELDVSLPSLDIPTTLHDSLMARLDRLSPDKTVLQVGATIGRQFDYSLVQQVTNIGHDQLGEELNQLIEAGILHVRGALPAATYTFKHALIQDAAYVSLLRRTRQQYHARIAETLEQTAPETPPEVLAHHYTEAAQAAKAVLYWHSAGQAALESWALAEATQHLERGLLLIDKMPSTPESALEELSLRVAIGVPLMLTRGFAAPDVEATYRRAFDLCSEVGETAAGRLFPALFGLWIFYQVRAMYPQAEEMGKRLLDLARRSGDSGIEIGALQALGACRFWRGRVASAKQHFERVLEIYEPRSHRHLAFLFGQDARAFCLAFLIWVHWHDGDYESARQRRQQALDYCEELGQPGSQSFVEILVATFHCHMGEYNQAEEHARTVIALSEEQGMPHWEACGRIMLGWSIVGQGRASDGAEIIRAGIDALDAVGTRNALSFWRGALIEAELKRGRIDEARAVLHELMDFVQDSDERCHEAELVRLGGEILLAESRLSDRGPKNRAREESVSRFRRARDLARAQGAKTLLRRAEESLDRTG